MPDQDSPPTAGQHPRSPSRRGFLLAGAGAVALAPWAGVGSAAASTRRDPGEGVPAAQSVRRAYAFLAAKLDEFGEGTALRVPRSYTGGFFDTGSFHFLSSFAYDDSLMVMAWLARGTTEDLRRAVLLGDTLLYAQEHDPIGDGRTRASYQPDSFRVLDGRLDIGSPAAYTGNQAWVGMAFAHLYARTGQTRFLAGALRLGRWVQDTTYDGVRAPFGYTGGRSATDTALTFKATEHNIDTGAFYTMLAELTGDAGWRVRAGVAFSFVRAMVDAPTGHLWTGTDPDGTTINRNPVPADVQTWSYLATLDATFAPAVTWVVDHLLARDGGFTGSSFSDTDVSKVWFEGTAHLALALGERRAPGDVRLRRRLLTSIAEAQAAVPNADGRGIVAASSDGLDTGFGDLYYASLHTGATAWYLMAVLSFNPFRLSRADLPSDAAR